MSDTVRSLTDLLDRASARRFLEAAPPEDLGLAEHLPFPFLALVGQEEMKLALLLSLINPNLSGVLLVGPRGTGKTTAVRSLADLMPSVERSRCPYGCLPEDIETGGLDAVCPDCAERYSAGEPLTYDDPVRLIELPLNATLEDVVGGLDERAALHERARISRGILSKADRNVLYVDEVNLLDDEIVDAILDASSQGTYTVHRGPVTATYRSRFVLVGSMNPEEGRLRPQILDRFGLRVIVEGLQSPEQRLQAYQRAVAYRTNARKVVQEYSIDTGAVREEVIVARDEIASVEVGDAAHTFGLRLVQEMEIESLRAEITLFEAARAHAIADGRKEAAEYDIRAVAPMALRMRRSEFIEEFLRSRKSEEERMAGLLDEISREHDVTGPPGNGIAE